MVCHTGQADIDIIGQQNARSTSVYAQVGSISYNNMEIRHYIGTQLFGIQKRLFQYRKKKKKDFTSFCQLTSSYTRKSKLRNAWGHLSTTGVRLVSDIYLLSV